MENVERRETMVKRKVRYTLEVEDRLVIIENVPARVCLDTGEQFFSPETVEHLQGMVREQRAGPRS